MLNRARKQQGKDRNSYPSTPEIQALSHWITLLPPPPTTDQFIKRIQDLPGGPVVEDLPASAGAWVRFLGQEDSTCCRATNTGVGCHALPQEIVPAQGSNSGLLNCWQILYCLIHQETVLLLFHGAVHGGSMLSIKVIFPFFFLKIKKNTAQA